MTQLLTINQSVLTMTPATAADDVAELMQRIDFAKQHLRELEQQFKAALIEWINTNGDLTIGDKRYYVTTAKRTKPKDLAALTEAVMQATGGDFDKFVKTLGANAYKLGACKTVLGDEWDIHFTVEPVDDLKTGKPKKEVKCIDERFVRTPTTEGVK